MSDQDIHVVTEQETAIYDALTTGDHDAIDAMQDAADSADQTPPDPEPEDWLSPANQFDEDYAYAWAHYQADHEAPEPQREAATKVAVHEENIDAADREGLTPEQT